MQKMTANLVTADGLEPRRDGLLISSTCQRLGRNLQATWAHLLRRIKASISYKPTGNIRAIQILLDHSKIENTVPYLRVDIKDALIRAHTCREKRDMTGASAPSVLGLASAHERVEPASSNYHIRPD